MTDTPTGAGASLRERLDDLIAEARRKAPTFGVQEWDWLLEELTALSTPAAGEETGGWRDTESLRVLHARTQGRADGFQQGWHAALDAVLDKVGDAAADLREQVPILIPAPPTPERKDSNV